MKYVALVLTGWFCVLCAYSCGKYCDHADRSMGYSKEQVKAVDDLLACDKDDWLCVIDSKRK